MKRSGRTLRFFNCQIANPSCPIKAGTASPCTATGCSYGKGGGGTDVNYPIIFAIIGAIALTLVISQNGGLATIWNKFSPFGKPAAKVPFYFLADSAYKDVAVANRRVEKLQSQGYKEAGSFWIPDYPNLGSVEYQQVYTSQFPDLYSCLAKLQVHRKYVDDVYCAFASPDTKDLVQKVFGSDLAPPNPSPIPLPLSTPTATPLDLPQIKQSPLSTPTATPLDLPQIK